MAMDIIACRKLRCTIYISKIYASYKMSHMHDKCKTNKNVIAALYYQKGFRIEATHSLLLSYLITILLE